MNGIDDFAFTGSQENVGTYADGEVIILTISGGDTNENAPEILANAVWTSLPAVKADTVMEVSSDTFIGGIGYGAAMDVVNTIGAYFDIPPVILSSTPRVSPSNRARPDYEVRSVSTSRRIDVRRQQDDGFSLKTAHHANSVPLSPET